MEYVEYVKDVVVTRKTHSEVSLLLKEAYPGRRGLSLRSVRRFCFKNGIHVQNRLSNDELEQCTKEVVARVGMLELFMLLKKNYYFICWLVFIVCRFLARNPILSLLLFCWGGRGRGVGRMVERGRMLITRKYFAYDQNNP